MCFFFCFYFSNKTDSIIYFSFFQFLNFVLFFFFPKFFSPIFSQRNTKRKVTHRSKKCFKKLCSSGPCFRIYYVCYFYQKNIQVMKRGDRLGFEPELCLLFLSPLSLHTHPNSHIYTTTTAKKFFLKKIRFYIFFFRIGLFATTSEHTLFETKQKTNLISCFSCELNHKRTNDTDKVCFFMCCFCGQGKNASGFLN